MSTVYTGPATLILDLSVVKAAPFDQIMMDDYDRLLVVPYLNPEHQSGDGLTRQYSGLDVY